MRRSTIFRQRNLLRVYPEYFLAPAYVGPAHYNPAVKTAGAQQRGIEYIGAIGCGDKDDTVVGLKAIHLDQQLIEGLLALIVPTAQTGATVTTNRVDFVDENDAGRIFLSLLKEVAHRGWRRRRRTSQQSRNLR